MPDRFLGRRLLAAARLNRWENELARAVGRALARAQNRALASIAVTAAIGDPFGEDEWDTDIADEVVPIIEQVLREMTDTVTGRFPLSDAATGRVLARIDPTKDAETFLRLVRSIGPDAARRINEALAYGVGMGEAIPELAGRVESVFAMATRRAETIARTETARAANRTAFEAATEVGKELAITKTWLATADERTRETHADADGQTVALDDTFDVGGWPAMFPCDPELPPEESVNCRCAVTFDAAEGDNPDAEQQAAAAAEEAANEAA